MREQFFGKTFWIGLGATVLTFIVALFAYRFNLSLPVVILIGLVVTVFAARHPSLGLIAVFLELFSNPHGHLIPFLRIAVFIGFFVGYLVFLVRTKTRPKILSSYFLLLSSLSLPILLGFFFGLLANDPLTTFRDGNAYVYLLYLIPILGHRYTPTDQNRFLQILAAGALWNIMATLGILYIFTHFDESFLRSSYVFLRDVRFAEITNVTNGFYRVFIQSQFFTFVFGSILFALLFQQNKSRERWMLSDLLGATLSIFFLSLSRSFWVGTLVGLLVLVSFLIRTHRNVRTWLVTSPYIIMSIVTAILLIIGVSLFPLPQQRFGAGDLAEAFSKRTELDVAISSRWQLLTPMKEKIINRPILGNGFGTTVSFVSDDPRVREIRPDGIWTTYAMEWGWLELWLKMGVLGPLAFLCVFVWITQQLLIYLKTDRAWIGIGFIASLVFLYITHVFSPYLNHPIGLGFLLFTLLFLPEKTQPLTISARFPKLPHIPKETPEPSSALSLQAEE